MSKMEKKCKISKPNIGKLAEDHFSHIFKKLTNDYTKIIGIPNAVVPRSKGYRGKESQRSKKIASEAVNKSKKKRQTSLEAKKDPTKVKKTHRRIVSNDYASVHYFDSALRIRPETGSNQEAIVRMPSDKGHHSKETTPKIKGKFKQKSAATAPKGKHRRAQSNLLENYAKLMPKASDVRENIDHFPIEFASGNYNKRLKDLRQRFNEITFKKHVPPKNISFDQSNKKKGEESNGLVKKSSPSSQNFLMVSITKKKPMKNNYSTVIKGKVTANLQSAISNHRRIQSNDFVYKAREIICEVDEASQQHTKVQNTNKQVKGSKRGKKKSKKKILSEKHNHPQSTVLEMIRAKDWKIDLKAQRLLNSVRTKSKCKKGISTTEQKVLNKKDPAESPSISQTNEKKIKGKGHKKNAHSMPFSDPTNQLIKMLNLPINLEKKEITMTPDISKHNSPKLSPRIDAETSFISLVHINEDVCDNEEEINALKIAPIELDSSRYDSGRNNNGLQISLRSEYFKQVVKEGHLSSNSRSRKEVLGQGRGDSNKLRFASRKNSFKLLSGFESKEKKYNSNSKVPTSRDKSLIIYDSLIKEHVNESKERNKCDQDKKQGIPIKREVLSSDISRALSQSKRKNKVNVSLEKHKKAFSMGVSSELSHLQFGEGKSMPIILQKLILQNKIREQNQSGISTIVTTLDYYKFNRLLGEGSFGKVYQATNILCEKDVAIKCFDKAKLKTDCAKKKIFQEVKILKMLDHRNVAKLLEVFENKKFIFFVLEYAEEGDILKLLKEKGPLSEDFARYLITQVIYGLKHCHKRRVLHRDIKLDNVLLGRNYVTKICDFGVSAVLKSGQTLHEQCGTPAYIAPEVIKGEGYSTFEPDVWNLGITLYAMVTGTVPFKSNSIDELHQLILSGKFSFPPTCKLSEELRELICQILVLEPSQRITLEGMLSHPWIKSGLKYRSFENMIAQKKVPQERAVAELASLGFNHSMIDETLRCQILNHINACYHLMKYE